MTNPINKVKQISTDYRKMDVKDKKQFWNSSASQMSS